MAAELEEAFPGVSVKLIPSGGGVFEVMADGKLVFSKSAMRRHAEPGEIVKRLRGDGPR